MSGFGGGFGSAPSNAPFGSPPVQNPSPNHFGGFGAAPPASGFGAAPSSGFGLPPVSFGGGFGASSNTAFPFSGVGPSSSSAFGNAPPTPAYGSSMTTTGFGGAPSAAFTPAFGASTTMTPAFGVSTPAFGASATSTPAFGVSNTATPTFGVSATSTPAFGASATSTPAFGASAASTPFGAATGTTSFGSAHSATRFGGTPAPFVQPPAPGFGAPALVISTPYPFRGPATASPAPSISFGVSSNVAAPTPSQTFSHTGFESSAATSSGYGVSNTTSTGFGSSSFRSASATLGFAPSTVRSPGFGAGAPSDNEDMMDGGGGVTPYGTEPSFSVWPTSVRTLSPVPEPSGLDDFSMSPTPANDEAKTSEEELKAKIQEKKKRLAELKRRKEAAAATRVEPAPTAATNVESALNADAQAFVPGESKSLADRNATRFAVKPSTTTHLPGDLQNREDMASAYKEDGPEATQDIENAVSLVGTCPHMCPDDELLRRQREGDIQLLEMPQPGTIHPQDWTLRETAVKRFRRSAADYKLDVPEWVRPPDVLEKVCGYLEEWVMERDRQGADSRYPESESPPPLDVYQFIWDRTRMVRKDFILQNYVGTGGECDARAVRCHERIARWHAMCEHQLCHIPDFVSAQSQQNIQELGQTMKTLNQYYDDSLGRSVVEIPDEEGRETRTDFKGRSHGCSFEFVRGTNPTDFDGTPLKNDASSTQVSKRLIGAHAVNSASRGTAEPEMRGLYILLTMNNDGGMEVLKYASYLFQNRREVYDSKPVQLAMQIYKAKKEFNYARFFSIMRDPSTPYLFACIMFKYVEQMRKAAFRIMAKTYGAKRKDTGEAMYDAYPLKRLAILLCFEDMDEARAACKHYNITVKAEDVLSTSSPTKKSRMEIIYWRISEFKESKDPIKKVVLPLKPRKMIRTIESKLQGATRLAVCRGEVSGDGASLSIVRDGSNQITANRADAKPVALSTEEIKARKMKEESARRLQEEQQQQMEELAAKRKMEEKRRMREEQKWKEEEKRQQEEARQKEEEEAKRQAVLLQKQKEAELKQKQAEDERRRKLEVEEVKRAAEAAAREEQMHREAEEQRREKEREEARIRIEAEKRKRLIQEELQRKREEEQRKEKIRLEEEERKRQEQETLRLYQLKLQREREEQERRRREEEARRIAEAREAEIIAAKKLLIWRRLRSRLFRELQKVRTRRSLCRIDPTLSNDRQLVNLSLDFQVAAAESDLDPYSDLLPGMHVLDLLSRKSNPPLELSAMLRKASYNSFERESSSLGASNAVLAKLAVVLPAFVGPKADSMQTLLHMWLGRRLRYRNVVLDTPGSARSSHEVRTVVSTEFRDAADCDMVLFVIPPFFGDESLNGYSSSVCFPRCDDNIPQALLCLDDGESQPYTDFVNNLLSTLRDVPAVGIDDAMDIGVFDVALEECCDALLRSFIEANLEGRTRGGLSRMPISQLCSSCIRGALWRAGIPSGAGEEDEIMNRTRETLIALFSELNSLASTFSSDPWWNWPAHEFAKKDGVVKDYFGEGIHLPLNWKENPSRSEVESALHKLYSMFDGSLRDVVGRMTDEAPERVREVVKDMLSKRQFRRCLEYSLVWREAEHEPSLQETVVYLPEGNVRDVIEGCIRRMALENDGDNEELDLALVSGNVEVEEEADEKENSLRRPVDEPVLREENDWVRGGELRPLAFDGSQSFGEALRTPENAMTTPSDLNTPMTPVGVKTPLTVPGSKRSLDSAERDNVTHGGKRRKDDHLTKNQVESMAFTVKLEALLKGEITFNVDVGQSSLSELLRDAPGIQLPSSFRTD